MLHYRTLNACDSLYLNNLPGIAEPKNRYCITYMYIVLSNSDMFGKISTVQIVSIFSRLYFC